MNLLASLFLSSSLLAFQPELGLLNTQIVSHDQDRRWADYNRLRADISMEHSQFPQFLGKIQLDIQTRYTQEPSSLTNDSSIYRAYLEYGGERHFLVIGRQRVPFGVGRVWNPIDVFNPIDALAIETGERTGTEAIRYEYALSELSNFDLTFSANKHAARIKGFLQFADFALVGVYDNDRDQDIIGWEIEGELFATGIDLRSEGGHFRKHKNGQNNTAIIGGIEYGFPNSLTLLGEYYFNDEEKSESFGCTISYQPSPLWSISMLSIIDLNDHSAIISPTLQYSLSDETTINAGAFLYSGGDNNSFSEQADTIFLRWYVHF